MRSADLVNHPEARSPRQKAAERRHLAQWLAYLRPATDTEPVAITQVVRAVVILDRIAEVERDLIAASVDEYGLPVSLINFTLRYEGPWNLKLHRAIDELYRVRAERLEAASEAQFEPTELSPQVFETTTFEPESVAQRSVGNEAISEPQDETPATDPAEVPSTVPLQPLDWASSTSNSVRQLQNEPNAPTNSNPKKARRLRSETSHRGVALPDVLRGDPGVRARLGSRSGCRKSLRESVGWLESRTRDTALREPQSRRRAPWPLGRPP